MHRSLLPSIASTSRRSASVDAFVWRSCHGCRGHAAEGGRRGHVHGHGADNPNKSREMECGLRPAISALSHFRSLTGPSPDRPRSVPLADPCGVRGRSTRSAQTAAQADSLILPLRGISSGGGGGPDPPPPLRDGVVAWITPTPPIRTLILGVCIPPKSGPQGPNFSGFLTPPVQSPGGVGGLRPLP